jgi:hypothetical protein
MNVNDIDQINTIKTREDLARFVVELSKEYKAAPDSWVNNSLHAFLAALAGWIEDMDGYYTNQEQPVPTAPEWRTVAQMLAAARYYE